MVPALKGPLYSLVQGAIVKSSCDRSMNATFQSGAMGHRISAQKMYMCRTGFPVMTMPTAMKRDAITMTNSARRFLAKMQGVHLRSATRKSTPKEVDLVTVISRAQYT